MRRVPHTIALLLLSLSLAACAGGEAVRAEADASVAVEAPAEPAAPEPAAPEPVAPEPTADEQEPAASEPTQAELDFAAIYRTQPYDPVADPSLPPPAELPESYDPWEPLNRRVHRFNNAVDRYVASPLAHAYVEVVPRPVRLGVRNFFSNLGQPV